MFAIIYYALWFILIILAPIGWVLNLVAIASTIGHIDGMLILRVIGVFVAPIGAVLGYV